MVSRKENCDIEKEIFLASLVTYLPNKKTVKIIQVQAFHLIKEIEALQLECKMMSVIKRLFLF